MQLTKQKLTAVTVAMAMLLAVGAAAATFMLFPSAPGAGGPGTGNVLGFLGILLALGILFGAAFRRLLQGFTEDLQVALPARSGGYKGELRRFGDREANRPSGPKTAPRPLSADSRRAKQADQSDQSFEDPMTGLFNRRYFDILLRHEFAQSKRSTPSFLVVINLNDFHRVRESVGQEQGNRLLVDVANFLEGNCRSTDTLARLGDDEFAIILVKMDKTAIRAWAESFAQKFDSFAGYRPVTSGLSCACKLNMGIAEINCKHHDDAREVFTAAADAMYQARLLGMDSSHYICSGQQQELDGGAA